MSADDTYFTYHLTANGWVRDVAERPADAIETWQEHLTQSSIYSETFSSVKVLWASPEHSEEVRKSIRDQFPEPFEGGSPPPLAKFKRRPSEGPPKPKAPTPLFDDERKR